MISIVRQTSVCPNTIRVKILTCVSTNSKDALIQNVLYIILWPFDPPPIDEKKAPHGSEFIPTQ